MRIAAPTSETTRPTTSAMREAVLAAMDHRLDFTGLVVLDLFCGSGVLGIEALSRGAHHVTFVDSSRSVCLHLRGTLNELGLRDSATIVCTDALHFLRSWPGTPLHVVFADPPYNLCAGSSIIAVLESTIGFTKPAVLMLEHGTNEAAVIPSYWTTAYTASRGAANVVLLQLSQRDVRNSEKDVV